ncbi:MAG: type IV toxin-antitoxin system AbiEi family antitoxin domain-containing protein [Anaerolineae bacterium]|nr:type IV toxin-antitoxin system AbiEi family antitoxin domain-containing protein [Anaerolineae bacterium]
MDVKQESPLNILREALKANNGMLLTSDLAELDIPRTYLSILEQNGEIQRVSRGVYSATGSLDDEMYSLQARYKRAIYSHETALYLHELTDRSPLCYSVTVPTGYNATSLKAQGHKVFFVKRDLYPLGETTLKSPHGNDIQSFSLERTICDLLRSRNQIDTQIVTEALKQYVGLKSKNLARLVTYAQAFGIQQIVRQYVEVLL